MKRSGSLLAIFLILGADNSHAQWVQTSSGLPNTEVISFASSGANLFAGTYAGVFLSTNDGTTWAAVNYGLTGADKETYVNALAFLGNNLFAGTDGGVFISTNSGGSWTPANAGLTSPHITALAVLGKHLIAGTGNGTSPVFLSANNGESWTAATNGPPDNWVLALAVSGTTLYAGTSNSGVSLSTDNGMNWTSTGLRNTYVSSLAVSGTNLFAGAGGVYLSTNGGTSWTTVNSGLPTYAVYPLAVSGTDIFAGSEGGGVYLSKNHGASWTPVGSGLTYVADSTIRIGDQVTVSRGTECVDARSIPSMTGAIVHECEPAGTSGRILAGPSKDVNGSSDHTFWQVAYSDGVIGWSVSDYLIKPGITPYVRTLATLGKNLFAGTNYGVWRIPLSKTLPVRLASFSVQKYGPGSVQLTWTTDAEVDNYGFYVQRNGADMAFISGHGTTLEQHTYSYTDNPSPGLYQYGLKQVDLLGTATLSETIVVEVGTPAKFALNQNFPNPFNPTTRISFSTTKAGPVTLRVYDVVGREVATLINEERTPGEYTERFDGSQMASGMYIYMLKSPEGLLAGRMMLLK